MSLYGDSVLPLADQLKTGEVELELRLLELYELDELLDELELAELELSLLLESLLELPAAKYVSQSMKVPSISAGTLVMSARVR